MFEEYEEWSRFDGELFIVEIMLEMNDRRNERFKIAR